MLRAPRRYLLAERACLSREPDLEGFGGWSNKRVTRSTSGSGVVGAWELARRGPTRLLLCATPNLSGRAPQQVGLSTMGDSHNQRWVQHRSRNSS
eukprot:scaffold517_cov255-Pinguiococcus_pyrenoidosus.AAC.22